jgi:hypothetical protein
VGGIASRLDGLNVDMVKIKPIPSNDELKKRGYNIRSEKDLKILYSVDMTDSVILVTSDDDFRGDVKGINAEIKSPENYLYEKEKKKRRI